MSAAREAILERVREALGDVQPLVPADGGEETRPSPTGSSELQGRFVERVSAYGADVRICGPQQVAEEVAKLCAEHGAKRVACPADLPGAWRSPQIELIADEPALTPSELDQVDGVVTGCALASAETGTLALDHGPGQGRRALTLLPDLHICVLAGADIVPDIPELIGGLAEAVGQRRPLTLISGPSATSDIELERVEGVHGPRRLVILLVSAQPCFPDNPDSREEAP